MKKRLLSIVLGIMIGCSTILSLGGCGKKQEYDFTVWVPLVSSVVGEYADHPVFKKLEEISGLNVEFIHGEYSDIQNMFATNTYYDVMILNDTYPGFGGTYPGGGVEKGISDGKIRDISASMAQDAPNYSKYVNADADIKQEVVLDDGRLTRFFEVADAETGSWYGYMMREDWLIKVGYVNADGSAKIPVTYDDWEQVLSLFKSNKLSSSPLFLYSKGVDPFNSISAGYGVTFDFQKNENGVISYGPYMNEFESYLNRMSSWYTKGFIDKGFMLSKEAVAISKAVGSMNKDATFGVFTQMYIYMSQYENMAQKYNNKDYKLVAVPNPKVNSSDTLHIRQKSVRAGNYAVITDKLPADKVSAVTKWLDYLYSDEGKLLMSYGVENESYTMVDGKPQYTDLVKSNNNVGPSDAIKKYSAHGFPMLYDAARENQVAQPKEIDAKNIWTKDNDAMYVLPNTTLSVAESDEYSKIMTSLQQYVEEYIYNYIAGKQPIPYAEFQAKLKSEGIERATALKQASYDRYIRRLSGAQV